MLHKLVKLVQVDVDQELRGEVAQGQAYVPQGVALRKAADYTFQKPKDVLVGNVFSEDFIKDSVVYGSEELFDVALEYPTCASMVAGHLLCTCSKLVPCFVGAFAYSAGVGVGYECVVEEGIQNSIDSTVKEPVAYRSFVDVAGLGVADFEVVVWAVDIRFVFELLV